VDVAFQRKGWAGVSPLVNGQRLKNCLWDTGASRSLAPLRTVNLLLKHDAVVKPLERPTNLVGLGEGALPSLGLLHAILKFKDGKARTIVAHVCKELPFDMIIGLDFMQDEGLGCFPNRRSLTITAKKTGKTIDEFFTVPSLDCTINLSAEVDSLVQEFRVLNLRSQEKRLNTWLGSLKQERRDLLDSLLSSKLCANVTQDQFRTALQNICDETFHLRVFVASSKRQTEQDEITSLLQNVKSDFPEGQEHLLKLIEEFKDIFSAAGSDVGHASGDEVEITLKEKKPVNIRNYRTPLKLRDVLKVILDELMEAGIIERCKSSAYNSPCLLVPKKLENGDLAGHRLVIDYRQLNKAIDTVVFPMPRVQDILCCFKGCRVFSVMDIRHAYYTIRIDEKSRHLTAFSCEFGKFQFKFLPQGLSISPAVFQNRIQSHMDGIRRTNPFMDDISTATPTVQEHLDTLRQIFTRLRKHGYKLKLSKCEFLRIKVTFVGLDVSARGVHVSDSKKDGVKKLVPPRTVGEILTMLGFSSFLRAHVPYYCDVVAPIQALSRLGSSQTNVESGWTPAHDAALERLKELLLDDVVLCFPDTAKPFELFTDASKLHMSAVLMQNNENNDRQPIGYWSKAFKGSQLSWSALVKEARAVKEAVQHFAVFISGCHVTVRCDHKPLQRFLDCQTKNTMVNRWSLEIQEFNLKFKWVSSQDNLSDCLSRTVVRPKLEKDGLFKKHTRDDNLDDFPEKAIIRPPKGKGGTKASPQMNSAFECLDSKNHTPTQEFEQLLVAQVRHPGISTKDLERIIRDDVQVIDGAELTNQRFRELQEEDGYVKRVKERLKTCKDTGPDEVTKNFKIISRILYKWKFGIEEGREHLDRLTLVIPQTLIITVIANTHEELVHPGRDKMVASLERKVYWKTLRRDVNQYIMGCEICKVKTLRLAKYQNKGVSADVDAPMQRVALDIWSCKPGIALSGMCQHSQYPFLIPIKDKTAESVVEAALQIISDKGRPNQFLTDNGPEFVSEKFASLCKDLNITHIRSAKYSPQTNSLLERWHGFLNAVIRLTIMEDEKVTWEKCARAAVDAYRKMAHTSTGETPHFLMVGRDPLYDIDHLLPTLPACAWASQGSPDFRVMTKAYALARKNAALARLKHQQDVQHPQPEFQVGDSVYLRKYVRTKIDPKWSKYWKVVSISKEKRTVIIKHEQTGRLERANVRNIMRRDPLMEILRNSRLDTLPGRSKLYMRADDLENLRWPAIKAAPRIAPEDMERLKEVVRNRAHDKGVQQQPPDAPIERQQPLPAEEPEAEPTGEEPMDETDGANDQVTERKPRQRQRPRWMDDFVTGVVITKKSAAHDRTFSHSNCT
jgi:hypothetical protein